MQLENSEIFSPAGSEPGPAALPKHPLPNHVLPGHALPGHALPAHALNDLFSATYEELRRLASAIRRTDSHATVSATTLVNEAWIKLSHSPGFAYQSRLHFKRIAGRAMRQLLIEAARRKHADKRGGDLSFVTFDEALQQGAARAGELLALDSALELLAALSPRQAMVVECRFFAGMDGSEIAQVLDISEATVQRDWRAAKAWLSSTLRQST